MFTPHANEEQGIVRACKTKDDNLKKMGEIIMANTEKFEMIANIYDTPERIQIAKISRTP